MEEKKLYTLLVYSENVAGILNQVTAVFTRRQVNIESLNVSASSIPGVHKYTITAWSDEDQIQKIVHQIEKKIGESRDIAYHPSFRCPDHRGEPHVRHRDEAWRH